MKRPAIGEIYYSDLPFREPEGWRRWKLANTPATKAKENKMPKKADTKTLANTLRAMLPHIAAGDRWAIAEAADRLEELEGALSGTIGRMMNVAFGLDTTDTKIKAVRDLKKAIAEAQAALATEGKEPLI